MSIRLSSVKSSSAENVYITFYWRKSEWVLVFLTNDMRDKSTLRCAPVPTVLECQQSAVERACKACPFWAAEGTREKKGAPRVAGHDGEKVVPACIFVLIYWCCGSQPRHRLSRHYWCCDGNCFVVLLTEVCSNILWLFFPSLFVVVVLSWIINDVWIDWFCNRVLQWLYMGVEAIHSVNWSWSVINFTKWIL